MGKEFDMMAKFSLPKKIIISFFSVMFVLSSTLNLSAAQDDPAIGMAVEFTDHAACAHVAKNKGWFKEAGLNVTSFDNYLTGSALAAGLARGDINAAYMCLIPAISAYANGHVPLKVVAGTHKYGYGLIVDPKKITSVKDLERPDIRIGCPNEGTPLDTLLHKMIEQYSLNEDVVLSKTIRMPPSKVFLALKMGRLDAGMLPEQFPTMGEELGLKVILGAQDLWPEMQGSVLVVKDALLNDHPEIVSKLVEVTRQGTEYIHQHPADAARICAQELTVSGQKVFPIDLEKDAADMNITPDVILKSITSRLQSTTDVDPHQVQQCIDYMTELGYIKRFEAEEILDLRFLSNE
ncbi:ABC-type nitrate/sulfonate/bicarbonate transport systems periplasmic components-like protein [uncultured Desulfobacterium sp.]|uniref:ABC-type nitrate/sulfonate/bicarbonate transport systems periplasmic components-like protein n=1 Tax=uncultured Desulfobacterium sp. TaxID=201089 RepID=A0A445MR03_9BACT|nr:ABC-type nitrate/sulfonate/bicarbonate transport systems periplasmic components-like protein [uncultured Desulfobacterium sp.]